MLDKPNLFEYNDFRNYLNDFYAFKKSEDKKFTKAYICKKLGLPNSRSYFQDVLNGKFVSAPKVQEFINLLELDKQESKYFRVLVSYNQTTLDPVEREIFFEQLITLNKAPNQTLTHEMYAYYKDWYHSVIRAVLNVYDFKNDYDSLSKLVFPNITSGQARESVELLHKLKLIKLNKAGYYKPTELVLSTGPFAQDELIRKYQINILDMATKALLKNNQEPQRMITRTLSVSKLGFNRIMKRVEKFSQEITSIIHKDESKSDRIYQLGVLLFPMAKGKQEKE